MDLLKQNVEHPPLPRNDNIKLNTHAEIQGQDMNEDSAQERIAFLEEDLLTLRSELQKTQLQHHKLEQRILRLEQHIKGQNQQDADGSTNNPWSKKGL
jgi:predicted  nucleic acid-binding Zn-ribbon protein